MLYLTGNYSFVEAALGVLLVPNREQILGHGTLCAPSSCTAPQGLGDV